MPPMASARKNAPPAKSSKAPPSPSLKGEDWVPTGELGNRPTGHLRLRRTAVPGVYHNTEGLQVDERGILLSLRQVKEAEADHDVEVLGAPVSSPAELLKRVALDPSLPLSMRISAAVSAAPYFDRKMPLALEGGDPDRPVRTTSSVTLKTLSALDPKERKAALDMLEKLGVL